MSTTTAVDARRGDRRARPVLELGALGLSLVASGFAWRATFGFAAVAVPVLLAVAVPIVLAALFARRRAPIGVVVALLLFVPVAVVAVLLAGSSAPARDLVDGLQRGWGDALSTAVPVAGDPSLAVVPVAVTFLAALVGGELVVRSRRVLAPLLAPLGLLTIARLYAPAGAATAIFECAGMALVGVALVAARHTRLAAASTVVAEPDADARRAHAEDARRLARRRTIVAAPVAVVAVLVGAIVGPHLIPASSRPAATLRDVRAPELATPSARDPLDELNGTLSTAPDTRLFTVTSPAADGEEQFAAPASRWTLLALDTFDGTSWGSSARYERAGTTLPEGPPRDARASTVRQTITVDQLPGTWLPVVGRPIEARAVDGRAPLAFDPVSGTLATDGTVIPPALRYDVVSVVVAPTGDELLRARLPSSSAFAAFTALPTAMPREIAEATRTAMANAHSPFEQVAALERYLQGNGFVFDPQALTGHSTGDLVRFLSDKPNARHGTAEQFATAFAVMARTRGLPTRLAVGFRPRSGHTWQRQADTKTIDLTRGDTDVWPEVYFEGLGWVAFDPVPSGSSTTPRPQLEPEEVAASKSRAADAATAAHPAPAAATNPILQAPSADDDGARPWLPVLVAVAALALVVVVVPRLARSLRRRRRRRARRGGEAGERILGAWREAVDHLERCGVGPAGGLTGATVTQVGDAAAVHAGDAAAEPVRALGDIVNRATFEPEPPTDADATRAWDLEAEIHRTIGRRTKPPAATPPADDRALVAP